VGLPLAENFSRDKLLRASFLCLIPIMSELKFICPACGQHMQCEKAYVGHQLPCPNCQTELRIPFSDSAGGGPDALPRAQIVLLPGKETNASILVDPEKMREAKATASDIPQEIIVKREPEISKPAPAAAPHELHCICPVCRSELKISAAAKSSDDKPRVAELAGKTSATPPEAPAESPHSSDLLERERKIAVARENNPVSLYPSMKPRLSYILNGGEKVEAAPESQNPDDQSAAPEKSFNE
jgi:hypothetical protein